MPVKVLTLYEKVLTLYESIKSYVSYAMYPSRHTDVCNATLCVPEIPSVQDVH